MFKIVFLMYVYIYVCTRELSVRAYTQIKLTVIVYVPNLPHIAILKNPIQTNKQTVKHQGDKIGMYYLYQFE